VGADEPDISGIVLRQEARQQRSDLGSIASTIGLELPQPSGSKAKGDSMITAALSSWMNEQFGAKLGKLVVKDLICLQAEALRFSQLKPRI
jgi:hypothetical protein